jgi:hypothetical protein
VFRLFSSIRQSLLAENRTLKYLKYAVGEVLLVMIGILLALSVNNWNEDKKLERQRSELIENLKSDFQANKERLEMVTTDIELIKEGLERLLANATVENSSLTVEELKVLAFNVIPNNQFEPSLGFYRSAISTGSIVLLKGSQLNNLFLRFEENNNRLQEMDITGFRMNFSDSGSLMDIREELGELNTLFEDEKSKSVPEAFKLSDEEYREFISQKKFYAHFSLKRNLKVRQLVRIEILKRTTDEILDALEALD